MCFSKTFLRNTSLHDIRWNKSHNYPFEFSTEASINLSDDPRLMHLMREANFLAVFVNVESPDHREPPNALPKNRRIEPAARVVISWRVSGSECN